MEISTHNRVSPSLIGVPILIQRGKAEVELETTKDMVVDDQYLIHGGFTFGLADYAAMLSVNHPYVVLGSAEVRFTAPIRCGDIMRATAKVTKIEGNRREVSVEVRVKKVKVLSGKMVCFVLDKHVLS